MDSYLFVVTESDLFQIDKNNKWAPHHQFKIHLSQHARPCAWVYNHCQFVFTGSREQSEELIPKILTFGKNLWKVDLQYYIDNKRI